MCTTVATFMATAVDGVRRSMVVLCCTCNGHASPRKHRNDSCRGTKFFSSGINKPTAHRTLLAQMIRASGTRWQQLHRAGPIQENGENRIRTI
jgi:hypothetical protein